MFRTIFSTIFGHGAAATSSAAVPGRAFSGLFVGIYDGPTGALLLDATTFIRSGDFGTDENGYADCNLTLELSANEQTRIFDSAGVKHLRVSWNGITAFEGRVQDTTLGGAILPLVAFGYRAALGDIPFTGLFSMTDVSQFKVVTKEEYASQDKDKYNTDNNNRVYGSLKKNQTYASGSDAFFAYTDVPHGSASTDYFKYATAYVKYNLPTNWTLRLIAGNEFASFVASNVTTTGGTSAGATVTWDLSATPRTRMGFQFYNSSGSTYTNSSDDGVYYVELTDIRYTSTDGTVYADDIVDRLVSFISGINAAQLQTSTALVQSPALEVYNLTVQDTRPKDVLKMLTTLGDNQSPPRVWEWGVWDNRYLHFQPRGYLARELYVDVTNVRVQRTLSGLENSYYATYRDESGRTLRTSVVTDSNSVTRNGVTIRGVARSTSTNTGGAEAQANMYLEEYSTPVPRSEIEFENIYDAGGGLFPPFLARSGDNVTLRNISQMSGETLLRARKFRVKRTRYDLITGRLAITPENDLPTLEAMLSVQTGAYRYMGNDDRSGGVLL